GRQLKLPCDDDEKKENANGAASSRSAASATANHLARVLCLLFRPPSSSSSHSRGQQARYLLRPLRGTFMITVTQCLLLGSRSDVSPDGEHAMRGGPGRGGWSNGEITVEIGIVCRDIGNRGSHQSATGLLVRVHLCGPHDWCVTKHCRATERDREDCIELANKFTQQQLKLRSSLSLFRGPVLIPFAVDGYYGGIGPMARRFLFGERPRRALTFRQDRPNATRMYARASAPPAPLGVVTLASMRWKQNQTRAFYGHSYTAPTPHGILAPAARTLFHQSLRDPHLELVPEAHAATLTYTLTFP
ncbi:hypothetical protein THAOC_32420, partial [Thalassiosira oceanica]